MSPDARARRLRIASSRAIASRCVGMRVLLAMRHLDTTPIKASDVMRLIPLGLSARTVLAVLEANGLLVEDRTPRIQIWFTTQTAALPEPMRRELHTWFDVLHRGRDLQYTVTPEIVCEALRIGIHRNELAVDVIALGVFLERGCENSCAIAGADFDDAIGL